MPAHLFGVYRIKNFKNATAKARYLIPMKLLVFRWAPSLPKEMKFIFNVEIFR